MCPALIHMDSPGARESGKKAVSSKGKERMIDGLRLPAPSDSLSAKRCETGYYIKETFNEWNFIGGCLGSTIIRQRPKR